MSGRVRMWLRGLAAGVLAGWLAVAVVQTVLTVALAGAGVYLSDAGSVVSLAGPVLAGVGLAGPVGVWQAGRVRPEAGRGQRRVGLVATLVVAVSVVVPGLVVGGLSTIGQAVLLAAAAVGGGIGMLWAGRLAAGTGTAGASR